MLVFEGGEALRFDREAIRIGVQGVWRLMGHLGMRPGSNEPLKKPPFVAGSSTWLRTSRGGVFHEATGPGDKVKEGEVLGVVMDIYGRTRAKVVAPWAGMVIGMACNPLVSRGDAVLHLARAE
jgi:predicted deacylase